MVVGRNLRVLRKVESPAVGGSAFARANVLEGEALEVVRGSVKERLRHLTAR